MRDGIWKCTRTFPPRVSDSPAVRGWDCCNPQGLQLPLERTSGGVDSDENPKILKADEMKVPNRDRRRPWRAVLPVEGKPKGGGEGTGARSLTTSPHSMGGVVRGVEQRAVDKTRRRLNGNRRNPGVFEGKKRINAEKTGGIEDVD